MSSYQSARGRATAITVLMIVQLVMIVGLLAGWLAYLGGLDAGDFAAPARFINALGPLTQLLFLTTFVVFLTWVYRATANLPALGSMAARFTPGWAVGYYFIPFVNIVRGHNVMSDIWLESQPAAVDEKGQLLPRSANIVHWWWGLYLVLGLTARGFNDPHHLAGIAGLREQAYGQLGLHALRLVDAVLFLIMVRGAQKRQDEQWTDLERRRNVPVPTADALR